jgi:hypothetical protein
MTRSCNFTPFPPLQRRSVHLASWLCFVFHLPCFIRWPAGQLGAPRGISELCHVQDLLPTIADLVGVSAVPSNLDGVSLAPLLREQAQHLEDRMLVINYSRTPSFQVSFTRENPARPPRDGATVLRKQWRWIENRASFNVETDPLQQHDVASDHPAVVGKMRAHLEEWRGGLKDEVMMIQRAVIGSDRENPLLLTAREWLGIFVDQQRQVRRGELKNGIWHLTVEQAGLYTFELRRFPKESGLGLQASLPETRVNDGILEPAAALSIARGRIRIGSHEATADPDETRSMIRFSSELVPGPIELQTWMLDDSGKEICGAYYVTVTYHGTIPSSKA